MGSSESKPAPQPAAAVPKPEFETPWRNFKWDQKDALIKRLEEFTPSNPDVEHLQILVVGQVGAGKTSFINSINNACQKKITSSARVSSCGRTVGFTRALNGYHIRSRNKTLPYVFRDTMGLEAESLSGADPDDIVKAVFGHLKDGYKFDVRGIPQDDQHYNKDPNLSDKSFCLVYVIAADTVTYTDDKLIDKLKTIRHKISDKGIPQVVIMTKVDQVCPLVMNDLKKIYTSKKFKEKMDFCRELCSDKIGIPMCKIFPVKNYDEEIETKDDVDVLILKALEQIVQVANDHLLNSSGH